MITGVGLTLCSKSRSTSNALFVGLFAAVTCYKIDNKKLIFINWLIERFYIWTLQKRQVKKWGENGITSPCIVQVFGSTLAFSICAIFDWSFSSCFSWVEGVLFFYTRVKMEYEKLVLTINLSQRYTYEHLEREREIPSLYLQISRHTWKKQMKKWTPTYRYKENHLN